VNGTNDKAPHIEEPRDRETITRGSVVAVGWATGPLTHSGGDSAYRRSVNRGIFAFAGSLVVKQVLHGPARRVMHTVTVRHEVVQVAVVTAVSSGTHGDTAGHNPVFLQPVSYPDVRRWQRRGAKLRGQVYPSSRQGWQRNCKGALRLPAPRQSGARIA